MNKLQLATGKEQSLYQNAQALLLFCFSLLMRNK
jgi:hypothetical protein